MNSEYTIIYSDLAWVDFGDIVYYIQEHLRSPITAKRLARTIRDEINDLSFMPAR